MSSRGGRAPRRQVAAHVASSRPVRVTYTDHGHESVERTLGHAPDEQQLATLAGARPGGTLRVRAGLMNAVGPGGHYQVDAFLTRDDQTNKPALFVWKVANRAGREIPYNAQTFAQQVHAARALGVESITTKGRTGMRDDVDLVRMGFDAPIAKALVEVGTYVQLPSALGHPRYLSELQSTPEGMRWWLDNRRGYPGLSFDTRPGSRSMRRLNAFLREHHA